MLVNHVPSFINSFWSVEKTLNQRQLRAAGLLTYCLFDFDLSLMLPSGKPLSDYRLPIDEAFPGVFYKPHGVEQGQVDFNPFAFDVGCLGIFFCRRFQVPRLQLLDKMPSNIPISGLHTHHSHVGTAHGWNDH